MPVRTRLKEIMAAKHVSRMDIVRGAKLSYPTILKWETKPLLELDTTVLHALLDFLDVKYEELVYEIPKESDQAEQ